MLVQLLVRGASVQPFRRDTTAATLMGFAGHTFRPYWPILLLPMLPYLACELEIETPGAGATARIGKSC